MRPKKIRKLFSDRMLVQMEPELKKTRSGIVIPDNIPNPVRVGKVLMVGPGRRYIDCYRPTEARIGERVVFFKGSTDTKEGKQLAYRLEKDQVIIRENDVLGVLEGDVEVTL